MQSGGVRRNHYLHARPALPPHCASADATVALARLGLGVTREPVRDDILRIRPREFVEHEKRAAVIIAGIVRQVQGRTK